MKNKEKNTNNSDISKQKTHKTRDLTVYIILRFIIILVLIRQFFLGSWNNVFLCILTLILFTIPSILDKTFKIQLPNTLENMIICFIFSAEILGEIHNFYGYFKYWDTYLHVINGFLCAAIGFSLIDILNRSEHFHFKMTPIFVAGIAFCFSMTIGVLWEFFEFGMDTVFKYDMQKDNNIPMISTVYLEPDGKNIPIIIKNIKETAIYYLDENGDTIITTIEGGYLDIGLIDTMKDLMVNFVGALTFSVFGFLYIKNKNEYKFVEQFIPVVKIDKNDDSED